MKWVIMLMFLIYVGTMFFLIYMRLRPAVRKKPPQRADGVQQRDEQQDEGDE